MWYIYVQQATPAGLTHTRDEKMKTYLNELVTGKTVKMVTIDTEGFPILVFTDGTRIRVCADSGENAPGFLRVG